MTHLDTLGLPLSASDADIKAAYRALRSKHHPDKGGDKTLFDAIQKAYDGLQNRVCPLCEGKGKIRERNGAFTKQVPCPRCWNVE